jgi:hypothetical protein
MTLKYQRSVHLLPLAVEPASIAPERQHEGSASNDDEIPLGDGVRRPLILLIPKTATASVQARRRALVRIHSAWR